MKAMTTIVIPTPEPDSKRNADRMMRAVIYEAKGWLRAEASLKGRKSSKDEGFNEAANQWAHEQRDILFNMTSDELGRLRDDLQALIRGAQRDLMTVTIAFMAKKSLAMAMGREPTLDEVRVMAKEQGIDIDEGFAGKPDDIRPDPC